MDYMTVLPPWLPLTLASGLTLFLLKEAWEFVRRWRADSRKRLAITTLLAQELGQLYFVHRSLVGIVNELCQQYPDKPPVFSLYRDANGKPCYRVVWGGTNTDERAIRSIHRGAGDKLLMDAAMLDRKLFAKMLTAYTRVTELEHLRETLIDILDEGSMVDTFAGYMGERLVVILQGMDDLYRYCTGKPIASAKSFDDV
ncbi:hypothetical protein [Falsiroseomonas sp. E2-1-a20]|uniref:hypothetical protein n=1 Tax=Falsiroseomonas sp. E2-1-a20 TaxID=3239300 RepID=UPI003F2F5234